MQLARNAAGATAVVAACALIGCLAVLSSGEMCVVARLLARGGPASV
jgi:hypothetical protein